MRTKKPKTEQVCTNVPVALKEWCKEKDIKYSYVFERGIASIKEETGLWEEIKEHKRKIESMRKIIAAQQRSINDTRDQLK